jgi:hypothetical protein
VIVDPSIEDARRSHARNSNAHIIQLLCHFRVFSKHVWLVSYEEVWVRLGAKIPVKLIEEWRITRLVVVKFERLRKNMFIGLR